MNEEGGPFGFIIGMPIIGTVFWLMAPILNEYLLFDLRLFALLCWVVTVVVIVTAAITIIGQVSKDFGGR